MTALEVLTCEACSCTTLRRGQNQRYCVPCSTARDLERKSKWAKDNPQKRTPGQTREIAARHTAALKAAGAARSESASLAWPANEEDEGEAWIVRVSVPFTYAYSKNAIWRMGKQGHVHLRKEARAARDVLTIALRNALQGTRVAHNRLWIDVMAEKPDHRGDAVNVLDSVSDAVQEATGLDDRWYSIGCLDWRVVKEDPRLIVGIRQRSTEDVQVCSYCGRVLDFDAFTSNRSTKTGRSRTCRECDRAARRHKVA